jgi:hypothetical protein
MKLIKEGSSITDRELLNLIARARDEEWKELNLDRLGLTRLPPEKSDRSQS